MDSMARDRRSRRGKIPIFSSPSTTASRLWRAQRGRGHGMQVLITDHHLPGAVPPEADAIVNPNQPGDSFGQTSRRRGRGVSISCHGLRAQLRHCRLVWRRPRRAQPRQPSGPGGTWHGRGCRYRSTPTTASWWRRGLRALNAGMGTPGVRALLAVAGRAPGLHYRDRPRFPLAGSRLYRRRAPGRHVARHRLPDHGRPLRGTIMAHELDTLNRERRSIEAGMQNQALAAVRQPGNSMPRATTRALPL